MPESIRVDGYALLRLKDYPRPLWFIVEHQSYSEDTNEDAMQQMEYYFEDSCPINFIRVKKIIEDGDEDPHGLFEFIAWKPKPADADKKGVDWAMLFPQLRC